MTKTELNECLVAKKKATDRSTGRSRFNRLNRWVDENHCRITLGARTDSPEFENRFFSMGLAQRIFPNAGFNHTVALTLMSLTYLAILTFCRVFFPLGDQKKN